MRRTLWLLALVLLAACGDAAPVATTPSTTTPTETSVTVGSQTTSTVTSTVPTTSVAVPTVSPSTTLPVIRVEGAPGQPVDVVVPLPEPHSLPDPWRLWMSADSGRVTGYVGLATIENASVRLVGTIPAVLIRNASRSRREPAEPLATVAGDYDVALGFATIVIRVSQNAPPYVAPITEPAAVAPARQLLGDTDLAGVALGTPDAEAEQLLTDVFGPPTKTTPWGDTCSGQFRSIFWPNLMIEFRRRDPQSPGEFVLYSYFTFDGGLPPIEQRLATRNNVTLDSAVAELRGADGNGGFFSTSLGGGVPPYDGWNVPGTQLIAFLDRDFVNLDARVRAIASPMGGALADC
ncbi:MAG: hypothetical protein ABI658_12480 [Acidimicrobiales bacterium]